MPAAATPAFTKKDVPHDVARKLASRKCVEGHARK
jgi:hypothetical protein